jgi:hypothetical protein
VKKKEKKIGNTSLSEEEEEGARQVMRSRRDEE